MKGMVLAIAHGAFDDRNIWNEPLQKSITRDIRRMAAWLRTGDAGGAGLALAPFF